MTDAERSKKMTEAKRKNPLDIHGSGYMSKPLMVARYVGTTSFGSAGGVEMPSYAECTYHDNDEQARAELAHRRQCGEIWADTVARHQRGEGSGILDMADYIRNRRTR